MNCKKGDLAYIVVPAGFERTLEGKYVTVLGRAGKCDLKTFGGPGSWLCKFHVPWFTDRRYHMVSQCYLMDSWLRPIRDLPGDDQTLSWAGLPQDVGVPA